MAIHAQIRKEINEYKPKLFFGLSGRQLIFSLLGITIGIVSYYRLSKIVGTEISGYIVIVLVAPLFAFGYIKVDGEPFEKYLVKLYRFTMYPKARVYISYITHHQTHQVLTRKEHRNANKAKSYSTIRETSIEEYNIIARQRENAATYKRVK
jgi:hypothetical protein